MKIGIIGSGIVGRVLGSAFLKEGHSVILGTRNTSKPEVIKWKTENPSGTIGTFVTAASANQVSRH
jgi:8-hydroxy-5-deazaflavin:NADPH oxidoreductase